MLTIAETTGRIVTVFKSRCEAEEIAKGINQDPEISAKVFEREDGKFVIELHNEDGFVMCL